MQASKDHFRPPMIMFFNGKSSTPIYPRVHYIFSDDDPVSLHDLKAHHIDSRPIILDFDSTGRSIVSAQSLAEDWQLLEVRIEESPSWMPAEHVKATDGQIIRMDGISRENAVPQDLGVCEMVRIFNERNANLRKVIDLTEKSRTSRDADRRTSVAQS
ncbi:hypothetical protein NEOLI_000136 [Neolecta irregularis DAH-3]|uniref:Uncharacterized protein n=1 Tax=Neolecta irregularis (strain DAH-3) TaxID=1198029 RepID=A0A1U7LQT0_NEOID|nr:hypothetical protein NEOLI_000136 [Neolecta irregularis DAH-3]|eukprot:OLL25030.1 hypothetical protein NEOLI_000136 [Neolecta irregularis DAH-3]